MNEDTGRLIIQNPTENAKYNLVERPKYLLQFEGVESESEFLFKISKQEARKTTIILILLLILNKLINTVTALVVILIVVIVSLSTPVSGTRVCVRMRNNTIAHEGAIAAVRTVQSLGRGIPVPAAL